MRAVYTFIIIFVINNAILADITFSLFDVDKCTKKHPATQILSQEDLARWTSINETLLLENFQTNYPLAKDLNGGNDRIKNAFVATVFKAYSDHYPLEFSVEDIWVVIAQGIGIHLNENAEKYRQLMVSHEGKKALSVNVDALRLPNSARPENGDQSIPAINWSAAVRLMGEEIKQDMKTDLATLLASPFSKTTAVEQAVFDCTLMDTVKSYYEYKFTLLCGLPQITLRGSPDDFQRVIDRVNQLRTIFTDFHWWLDRILPHLQQLKASAEGRPDIDWWKKICRRKGISGGPRLSGWLADFIPYIADDQGQYHKVQIDHHRSNFSDIGFSAFSESITQTDFILDNHGHEIEMKLIAGFLGIGQNAETGALRPCLGWVTALQKQKESTARMSKAFFEGGGSNLFCPFRWTFLFCALRMSQLTLSIFINI